MCGGSSLARREWMRSRLFTRHPEIAQARLVIARQLMLSDVMPRVMMMARSVFRAAYQRFVMARDEADGLADLNRGDISFVAIPAQNRSVIGKWLLQHAFFRWALCHPPQAAAATADHAARSARDCSAAPSASMR